MCLFPICISPLVKCLFKYSVSLHHFCHFNGFLFRFIREQYSEAGIFKTLDIYTTIGLWSSQDLSRDSWRDRYCYSGSKVHVPESWSKLWRDWEVGTLRGVDIEDFMIEFRPLSWKWGHKRASMVPFVPSCLLFVMRWCRK